MQLETFSCRTLRNQGGMRDEMYVQELLLGYRHPSHTALRAEPAARLRLTRGVSFQLRPVPMP